jgi:hypothetical protein
MSSAVTNLWRQFVQRRLWPVAILLVAALAAVPLALGKEPAPPAPAPPAPATDADAPGALAAQPIVAPAESARVKRRKVLGTAKNPFGVPKQDTASASPPDSPTVTAQQPSQDGGSTGGSTTPGGSTPPSTVTPTPAPTTPAEPTPAPKKYAVQEITVRFGTADDNKRQSVKRLQALPSEQEPVLIYLGVQKDGKTAVFLVGDGAEAIGDGECKPSPEQCETIRLRAGETEFLDITDESGAVSEQYQLDLIKIHRAGGSSDAPTRSRTALAAATRHAPGSELRSTAGRVSARLR